MLLACSLDWAVRSDSDDASQPETGSDVIDAPIAKDAADTSVPTDAPISPDAGDCAALFDTVTLKRKKARECELAMGQCMATVQDECGCEVVVKDAGSTQSMDFKNAVDAFIAACGKPPCVAACPPNGQPVSWFCMTDGTGTHCSP